MNNGPYPYYDIPEVHTPRELIEYGRLVRKDKPFLYKADDTSISSNEFCKLVEQFGTVLLNDGMHKKNIGIIAENSTEWCISFFSVLTSGNVAVPLDRNLCKEDIHKLTDKCDCSAIIYSEKDKKKIDDLQIRKYPLKDIYDYCKAGQKLISEGNNIYKETVTEKDDLSAIVFTSGTSSEMKGVMLTNDNLMSDAVACCKHVVAHNTQIFLPLHHTFPWASALFGIFLCDGTVHFSPNLKRLIKDIQNNHPQNISTVPMMAEMVYNGIWVNAKKKNQAVRYFLP